jgi:hypothetical protein
MHSKQHRHWVTKRKAKTEFSVASKRAIKRQPQETTNFKKRPRVTIVTQIDLSLIA